MSGHCGSVICPNQSDSSAKSMQRDVKQVVERKQLATLHEQVPRNHSSLPITQSSLASALSLQRLYGFCCLLIERDQALAFGLASGYVQPRSTIRVAVQAIGGQSLDLFSSRSTPSCDQECGTLVGTFQSTNRRHEEIQVTIRNVARNALWQFWQISTLEQRVTGNILPLPKDHILEKDREFGKRLTSRAGSKWSSRGEIGTGC